MRTPYSFYLRRVRTVTARKFKKVFAHSKILLERPDKVDLKDGSGYP